MKKKQIDREEFIHICNESLTMAVAAAKLGVHFNTFKRLALEYGCYRPNQGGKGVVDEKGSETRSIPLEEIIVGMHPSYQTYKLKNRLIKAGILENKCALCGIDSWQGHKISCELDHVNGNRFDHRVDNLRILCPNCHSQTDTFRSKNRE